MVIVCRGKSAHGGPTVPHEAVEVVGPQPGIWVWGVPQELVIDGVKISVLYLDTEGFESIGKSNVYDDRIFALATVLSSVLIYNLPETIREADISRLSFAVELAEEFYGSFGRVVKDTPF
ncbi:hypothetical protein QJS10_CPB15g01909 [Acorus calamus]|uniref:GB1/RHD3-type G domain-containing protein n=1 Tax=Acorus calamus TaxID=4465 RepID=A0AAV9D981_ACOCL|nr:hypothetical protein QJS10_CPB15g01909 [Acorus calamus]